MIDLLGVKVPSVVALALIGEIVVLAALVTAVLMAHAHRGRDHHYLILVAFLFDLLVLKPIMLSRIAGNIYGAYPWDGTLILPHVFMEPISTVSGAVTIFLGFKHRTKKDGKMFMPPKGRMHRIVGLVFIVSWTLTFILGMMIFNQVYVP